MTLVIIFKGNNIISLCSLQPTIHHCFLLPHCCPTMKFVLVLAAAVFVGAGAFVPQQAARTAFRAPAPLRADTTAEEVKIFDQEQFIEESKEMRLKHLEEQAMYALKIAVENYGNAVFRKLQYSYRVEDACQFRFVVVTLAAGPTMLVLSVCSNTGADYYPVPSKNLHDSFD